MTGVARTVVSTGVVVLGLPCVVNVLDFSQCLWSVSRSVLGWCLRLPCIRILLSSCQATHMCMAN